MQDLLSQPKRALEQHAAVLRGSLLYLDDGAAEAIAANVGLEWLLSQGVIHVCALETASKRRAGYSCSPLQTLIQFSLLAAVFLQHSHGACAHGQGCCRMPPAVWGAQIFCGGDHNTAAASRAWSPVAPVTGAHPSKAAHS